MAERKTIAWNSPELWGIYGRQFGQKGSGVDFTPQGMPILFSLGDSGVTKNTLGADWQFTHGVADSANPNTFYGGPARGVTKGSDLTKQMIERGMLSPQQVVDYMNQSAGGIDAALNPDGSISYTNIDHSNDFDFGNVLLGAGAAGLGYLSGGFGLGELLGSFGGSAPNIAASGDAGIGLGSAGAGSGSVAGGATGAAGGATGGGAMSFADPIEALIHATNNGATGAQALEFVNSINPAWTQTGLEFAMNNPGTFLRDMFGGTNASNVARTASGLLGGGSGAMAGLGALAGLLGGSKQAGTITSVNDIPDWLKPAAAGLVANAGSMFDQTNQPNPLLPAAQAEMGKTISGQYLTPDSNPFLKGTVDDALGQVKSHLNSQFKGPNFGSSAHQEWLGRGLANTALPFYSQNYQQERNRQFGAATAAPDYTQSVTASRFAPLNQYAGLLKGWGSQTSQPYFENKLGNAFGGAMTGYSLGQLFGR